MMSLPHIPAIRRGRNYESLDKAHLIDHSAGKEVASISHVNAGIIRKDLAKVDDARKALKRFSTDELLQVCTRAGEEFLNGTLPLGDKGHTQSARQYIETLSATSGLPQVM